MNFLELAADRFSVRSFSEKPVEQEKIDLILKAAQLAPTAVNFQPQMIYVLKSPEAMTKINRLCRCIYGAPMVFLICSDERKTWKSQTEPGYSSGEMDCSNRFTSPYASPWEAELHPPCVPLGAEAASPLHPLKRSCIPFCIPLKRSCIPLCVPLHPLRINLFVLTNPR